MEDQSNKLTGVFEGYLKKYKGVAGLHLFNDSNKRYFMLNLEKFEMWYFKNRKKKGKASYIPIRELLTIINWDEGKEPEEIVTNKEWGFEFKICTRSRTYLFNAYSHNDRDVWHNAFVKLMNYK